MFLKFSSRMLPHHMVAKTLLIWLKITHCTGLIPSKMQYKFQSIIFVIYFRGPPTNLKNSENVILRKTSNTK